MSTYKSEGIIIKRHNFGESSLILDFYTKEFGKVEAMARSARKHKGKLKGHLELFLCTDVMFARARNIDKTTSSFTIDSFSNLRKDFRTSSVAYYFSEVIEKITVTGHKDERIYHLLRNCLSLLDESASDLESGEMFRQALQKKVEMDIINLLVLFFQINILDLAGYAAQFKKCVNCSENLAPGRNYFSHSLGGIICNNCTLRDFGAVLLDDNAIKLMRFMQFKGGNTTEEYLNHLFCNCKNLKKIRASEAAAGVLNYLMNSFIEFNIERKIKSVDFLRMI